VRVPVAALRTPQGCDNGLPAPDGSHSYFVNNPHAQRAIIGGARCPRPA